MAKLDLILRDDLSPTHWELRWSDTRVSGGNRRFNYEPSAGGFWLITMREAYQALLERKQDGSMSSRYLSKDRPITSIHIFNGLRSDESKKVWKEITLGSPRDEPNWGREPLFAVAEQREPPINMRWRKIMIIDSKRKLINFRSTTTQSGHARKKLNNGSEWLLYNGMSEIQVDAARTFLFILENIQEI